MAKLAKATASVATDNSKETARSKVAWATIEKASCVLVDATPVHRYLATLADDLARMEQYDPNGPAATTLRRVSAGLADALHLAAESEVFVSVQRASELSGKPVSTISRLCRLQSEAIGAQKVAGAWSIHYRTFEQFIRRSTHLEEAA